MRRDSMSMIKVLKHCAIVLAFVSAAAISMPAWADDATTGVPAKATNAAAEASDIFKVKPSPAANATPRMNFVQSCIGQGRVCVLNGTPCCNPYSCKGPFPNTSCQ